MKLLLTLALILLITFSISAAPVNTLLRTGQGALPNNWSLNRLPRSGDTLMIPTGVEYIIDDNVKWETLDLYLRIAGSLFLRNGKLNLGPRSTVMLVSDRAVVRTDKGTPADRITIGGNTKYAGNQGPVSGPAFVNAGTPGFTMTGQALPVVFSGFTVHNEQGQVLLRWATSLEVDASHYTIERSADGRLWNAVGQVAAAGNSTSVRHYAYRDVFPVQGKVYYRIRQVDLDGSFAYTDVVSVHTRPAANLSAVHISALGNQQVLVRFATAVQQPVTMDVVSFSGGLLLRRQLCPAGGYVQLTLPPQYKGNYLIQISGKDGLHGVGQVLL